MIHSKDKNGVESVEQITIDVFSIKIFALLMCKGSVAEKAEALYNTITVDPQSCSRVLWNSSRIKNAYKKLLFFSELFPKKH